MNEPRVVQIVRLPVSLKEHLDKFAYNKNMSTSDCIRHAIAAYTNYDESSLMHGNSKYRTQEERREAKRRQRAESRRRLQLAKERLNAG